MLGALVTANQNNVQANQQTAMAQGKNQVYHSYQILPLGEDLTTTNELISTVKQKERHRKAHPTTTARSASARSPGGYRRR